MRPTEKWISWKRDQNLPVTNKPVTVSRITPSCRIHQWGNGPPVIVLPGMAGGLNLMAPFIRDLATDHRVIGLEFRDEFGLPTTPSVRYQLSDLVDDVKQSMELLRLERPAVVGVSFGGVVALELARRAGQKLGRVVVQGVGSHFERRFITKVASWILPRFPLQSSPCLDPFFNLLVGSNWPDQEMVRRMARQCWRTDQGVIAQRYQLVENIDFRNHFESISLPVLALRGDRDVLVSKSAWTGLGEGLPRGRLRSIVGAGHLAFATHPHLVAAEVRHFTRILKRAG